MTNPLATARLVAQLNAWVAVRGNVPGPLFQSIRRGGHITGQGITSQAVYNTVSAQRRRRRWAGQ